LFISPVVYLSKKLDPGIGEARGRVLVRIRIEWCLNSVW
jgi:hypothetical protein